MKSLFGQTLFTNATIMLCSASLLSCTGGCENTVKQENPNSDKSLKAVVFSRDCGATTGVNTQISIIPFDGKLGDEAGNIFVEDQNHSDNVSIDVQVIWESPKSLVVKYDPNARIFKKESFFDFSRQKQISIKYENLTH
jgi:hypothetical protein